MPLSIAFKNFELDESCFELRRDGEPVAVQPKVLDLILYLARRRERVVTKDELLETVWRGVVVTEASLSQALSLARRALDDTPEAQHTIRTVRSKGLRFVAEVREATAPRPARRSSPGPVRAADVDRAPRAGQTALDTVQDDAPRALPVEESLQLYAILHCEHPADGGGGWSLDGVDEVDIGRGSDRRSTRSTGQSTRVLTLTSPGLLMSRRHARLVRTVSEWVLVDERSRNGTFVNAERTDKRALSPGDVFECGRTLFTLCRERRVATVALDRGGRDLADALLPSVTPQMIARGRDLERVAEAAVPVLLVGESGVGKSVVAERLHVASRRTGRLVCVDAPAASSPAALDAMFVRARGGTLLVENIERLDATVISALAAAQERESDVRVVSTSVLGRDELERTLDPVLLTRLSGWCCELPPLRDRKGDLGIHVGQWMVESGLQSTEIEVAAGFAMARYDWPGNLRELTRRLDVAARLSGGRPIAVEHVFADVARV